MRRHAAASACLALLLAACATRQPVQPSAPPAPAEAPQQLAFSLASGTYRCEYGLRVEVQRDPRDANLIQVSWGGVRHLLRRNPSASGLPRYEDAASGLVWIDLPWKSVLLDSKSGKPLASECRGKAA